MKKFLALALCVLMVVPALLTGCGNASVKFGAGVYTSTPTTADATEDAAGSGKIDVTVAAVTVDADGKIVACQLDTASNTVKFTADGKALGSADFRTKYEQGASYGMVAYGGAVKEWFEQADAFEAVVAGKTLDEVKALVVEGGKGTEEVINAGCTIMINEFVAAIEKAYNAAKAEVSADAALKVSIATEQTPVDVTEERDGSIKVAVNIFASAVDNKGTVLACTSDCVEVSFTFDAAGVSTLDTSKAVVSKREQGTNYGMVAYGGAAKEWFEQADAFDAACIGNDVSGILALEADDGKGTADLQAAGCTIDISGFIKAATK